jgi:hypothetical protein
VNANDAGDDPAIRIKLPDFDEMGRPREITSPPGWPFPHRLEPDEPMAALFERLRRDPFVQEASQYFGCEPRLRILCPSEMTLAKWKDRYPPKPIRRGYGKPKAERNYYPDAVLARLLVALCDQLRAGELVLRGFDLDLREERPIDPVLYDLPHMLLDPGADEFRPEAERRGPHYCRLTLWPAPGDAGRASAEAGAESERAAAADPSQSPTPPALAVAVEAAIREALREIYRERSGDPPNINTVVPLVREQLGRKGLKATWPRIQSIADEDEFRKLRRPRGEKRRKPPSDALKQRKKP